MCAKKFVIALKRSVETQQKHFCYTAIETYSVPSPTEANDNTSSHYSKNSIGCLVFITFPLRLGISSFLSPGLSCTQSMSYTLQI